MLNFYQYRRATKAETYRHADRTYWDVLCFIMGAGVKPQFVATKRRELRTA